MVQNGFKRNEGMMRNSKIANQIRNLAFQCKSKDVFSCEFGNEFADRIEVLLLENAKSIAKKAFDAGIDHINKARADEAKRYTKENYTDHGEMPI